MAGFTAAIAYEDGVEVPLDGWGTLAGVAGGGGSGDIPATVAGGVRGLGFDMRLSKGLSRASSLSWRRISSLSVRVLRRWASKSL